MKYIIVISILFSLKVVNKPKSSLIFYSLRKNTALVYAHANSFLLITDLSPSDKAFQFSVKPSLNKFENGVWLKPNAAFSTNFTLSNGMVMHLGTHKLLYWGPQLNKLQLTQKVKVNTILLSHNPHIELKEIAEKVRFDFILVDATNPDYKIKQWILDAKRLGIQLRVLKKNPAFELYW